MNDDPEYDLIRHRLPGLGSPKGLTRLILCDWKETEFGRRLRELAEEYHARCEAFDRTRCTGRTERGTAVPENGWQLAQIGRHASEVRRELGERAAGLSATPKQWQEAIVSAAKRACE